MRVRNDYCGSMGGDSSVDAQLSVIQERTAPKAKFNASFEKKIEHLWFQSRRLGWSYDDFVVHLLEVLVILRHKDSMKPAAASKRRVAA